ncbi:uncharacterized protein CTRU02_210462 [Colletotrichum truncatum]|uniref:Uncharacterized protein n=1 Tax=Colletotrichum truncatum TaxID=5467 RepID=A0ACC3YP27_COLTU|nr:uncharacterized protein CTRU02_13936 [Colletotrichum truncatum]KAF6782779.1 hypothetical protein CTRU02_13936 [Colletotrichum truncatum]
MSRLSVSILWIYFTLCQLCRATAIDLGNLAPRDAYRDDSGSRECLQVWCDTSVCATDDNDAQAVASQGVSLIIGPDCAGWDKESLEKNFATGVSGPACPPGRKLYKGWFVVWRAWSNAGPNSRVTFVPWENFMGAECRARQDVECIKGPKKIPDPNTGLCMPWAV